MDDPERMDVSGFWTKSEWKKLTAEQKHLSKCMYVDYMRGVIPKPIIIQRYDDWKDGLLKKNEARVKKTSQHRLSEQKARMAQKLQDRDRKVSVSHQTSASVSLQKDPVEECLVGFSQLEVDESKRAQQQMKVVLAELQRELDTDTDSEPVFLKKRRLRKRKPVRYMELSEPDDDAYIWCDICEKQYLKYCTVHGPLLVIPDSQKPLGCPKPFVKLRLSGIPGAGMGVWTAQAVPSGVRFGPYKGVLSDRPSPKSRYIWQVRNGTDKKRQYVDGEDLRSANWMRYINCSRTVSEQNLQAYQYKGHIYYRTVADIYAGTELLVWYGPQYAKLLQINVDSYLTPGPSPAGDVAGGGPLQERDDDGPSVPRNDESKQILGNEWKHRCEVCSKGFTRSSHLKQHTMTHTGEKPFTCEVCSKGFTNSYNLKQHTMTHTGEKPFTCEVCSKSFTLSSHLKQHTMTHTGEKPFTCEVCSKGFTYSSNLKQHTMTHTGEKPFTCEVCSKGFTLSSHLKQHTMTHTGEKPFTCEVCSKSFTLSNDLKRHTMTHTGEKPFTCEVCSKGFTLSSHLKQHTMTHTGEKPFTCEVCSKGFTNSSNLKRHTMTHTGEKPFNCEVCGKDFTSLQYLKNHRMTHGTENHSHVAHAGEHSGDSLTWRSTE